MHRNIATYNCWVIYCSCSRAHRCSRAHCCVLKTDAGAFLGDIESTPLIPWVASQVVRCMVALPWTRVRVSAGAPSLRFVGRVKTVEYVELRGYCPWGWGVRPVKWIYRLWRYVRSWLWSSATRSSPLGYFCNFCKTLIIDPTFCGSWFSTGKRSWP